MGYRGRLIFPMTAEIARLDVTATMTPEFGFQTGYDPLMRTPYVNSGGTESTKYMPSVHLGCQVETEYDPFGMADMKNLGDENTTEVKLCFHFQELEDNGFVDVNGKAIMPKGSKLLRVLDQNNNVLDDYEELGLISLTSQPRSYGLSGGFRNLLLVSFRRDTKATV